LKLIASGTITITMVKQAKGRVPTLLKQTNQATGKPSNLTMFSDMLWGTCCISYVKSAKNLSNPRFNEIIMHAVDYMKVSQTMDDEDVIKIPDDEVEDIRANIVNNSSSEGEDCKLLSLDVG
jgi:hypothetical protein